MEITQISTRWWVDKQIPVYADIEYYSAMKRNEVQRHATEQMNLKNFMFSKRNLTQKVNIVWFHFYEMSRVDKSVETESRWVANRGRGMEESGVNANGNRVSFWDDENILEPERGDYFTVTAQNATELYTLKC